VSPQKPSTMLDIPTLSGTAGASTSICSFLQSLSSLHLPVIIMYIKHIGNIFPCLPTPALALYLYL
jgi:hypothetical protein